MNVERIFALPMLLMLVALVVSASVSSQLSPVDELAESLLRSRMGPGANPSLSMELRYYVVEGTTAAELRLQMDRLGPADDFGRHYDAWTEWYVRWSYRYAAEAGNCTLGPVRVDVEITTTLPRWEPPVEAPVELVDRWNGYLAILQAHEEGHGAVAIRAGRDVLRTLEGLPAYPTCRELEAVADAAGERVLDAYREQERSYDRTTDHGAIQGARFP